MRIKNSLKVCEKCIQNTANEMYRKSSGNKKSRQQILFLDMRYTIVVDTMLVFHTARQMGPEQFSIRVEVRLIYQDLMNRIHVNLLSMMMVELFQFTER